MSEEIEAICRQWAWNINEEAKQFGDDKRIEVLTKTATALNELAGLCESIALDEVEVGLFQVWASYPDERREIHRTEAR